MKTTTTAPKTLRIKTGVKSGAGRYSGRPNHNQTHLRIKTGVKSGGFQFQHNQTRLRIKTGVKSGGFSLQHNQTRLVAR
jgi:hypothetical protein